MKKHFPIAAVDIETARYYKPEEMNQLNLESLYTRNLLSDIVSISIVSIDKQLKIEWFTYMFKPKTLIDPKAAKIHGIND